MLKRLMTGAAALAVIALAVGCSGQPDETSQPAGDLVTDNGAPYYTTLAAAQSAAGDEQLIAVKFYTDWCSWCKVLDTNLFASVEGTEFFTNEMVLAKINAEVDTMVAQQYDVSGYPTMVLVDKQGNEVDRIVGFMPRDDYIAEMVNYSKGIGTLDDLLSQAEGSDDRMLMYRIADKYKYRGGDVEATEWFNRIIAAGEPTDSMSGEARLSLADMHRRANEFATAIEMYQAVVKDFGDTPHGEAGHIWTAITYRNQGDTTAAIEHFESFITAFPNSEDVDYARKQIARLNGSDTES